jgi:hypothetical protein
VGKSEGKRPPGRPRGRWEEKGWKGVKRVRDKTVAGCCEHDNESSGSITREEFLG